jgi:hypothetical protein
MNQVTACPEQYRLSSRNLILLGNSEVLSQNAEPQLGGILMQSARIPPHWTEDDEPSDPLLDLMKREGARITRANYISWNWGTKPRPWTG